MIHFKNHSAFTLIETMFSIAITAIVLTPLFILQGTVLQQISRASLKIERVFLAQQFMHEAKRAMPLDTREFTLEKKIDNPTTLLKYEIRPISPQSSLAQINNLYIEYVTISWKDGTEQKQNKIVNFVYKSKYKKRMKKGFILIELLIATLIAGMISILLLTALQQTNKFQSVIDNNIDIYTRATIFHHQLEKDIMGAFVPIQAYEKSVGSEKKQKKPPLDHIFYSANRDKKFDILTFITTNPLAIYWGVKTGSAKPRIARVVYRLKPEDKKKLSYILLRQEGSKLSFARYEKNNQKAPRSYQLIDGIKDLSITYTIVEKQQETDKKQLSYKTVNEWNWPQKNQQGKKEKPPLPQFITVNLVLWDNDYKRDTSFTFIFAIIIDAKQEKSPQMQQISKINEQKTSPKNVFTKRSTFKNQNQITERNSKADESNKHYVSY